MKKILLASIGVIALSGSMLADTVNSLGSAAGFNAVPTTAAFVASMTPFNSGVTITTDTQVPFWNNPSYDVGANGHTSNVGDVLAGLVTNTNLIGSDLTGTVGTGDQINGSYYAVSGGGPGDPNTGGSAETVNGQSGTTNGLAFNFTRNAAAYQLVLLFADSSSNTGGAFGTAFGTYTGSGSSITLTPAITSVNNDTTGTPVGMGVFNASGTYGFYATVCYANNGVSCTAFETYTTGDGNFGNVTGAAAWNHFALFQLASGSYVLGLTETTTTSSEGIGDFNDIMVELQAVPEPGTIAIMGLGLAALGILGRRRFARK
jgi:hypothetical protein